jgi:hypothetical protein
MKKIMKKSIITIFIAGTVICSTSCKKLLNQDSLTKLDESEVYSDISLVQTSLKGVYANWLNNRVDEQGTVLMMGTDETQQGAYQMKSDASKGGLDRYDGNLNSLQGQVTTQWNLRWPLVNEAAKIINGVDKPTLQAGSVEAGIVGEACFIRGFIDYELAMYWGEIPIRDLSRASQLGLKRQPLKDVWTFIIADLTKAAAFCPDKNDAGRATSGAALAMLGKAYMSAPESTGLRNFDKARDCFEKMMGRYTLVPYQDLWDYNKPNTAESIFEFQYSPVSPNNNKVQFQIGSRAVQNTFGDGCYFSGYDKVVPTIHAYETVANGGVWEDGDLRRDQSIRYDFSYYGKIPTLDIISWEGLGSDFDELKPHLKKYEDFRTDSHSGLGFNNMYNSGKNMPILRLGDIKLCYAECLNELNRTGEAITIVNQVRARAWGGSVPSDKMWVSMSQSDFRTQIMDERTRELFAENWRRIDLIRTGLFVDRVKKYNKWTAQSGTIQAFNMLYPIPDSEMKLNTEITPQNQNPGYH